MTQQEDPRALLAKMQAEEDEAKRKADELASANKSKREAILSQLRDADLEDVKNKCKMHGFTATELRGYLKTKGGGVRKSTAKKSVARKGAGRGRAKKAAA